jgi:alkylated DNA repair dioxygenase AlkB
LKDLFGAIPAAAPAPGVCAEAGWTRVPDGEWMYRPDFFSDGDADRLMKSLMREIPWSLHQIRIFGRWVSEPRQTAWFGDPEAVYTYSGVTMKPAPWTAALTELRRAVEAVSGSAFNSVLLNLYRGGQDSMGWHSDDEPELGMNPVIASLSFGAERRFLLRHRALPEERREIVLEHGSLLVMGGALQHHWQHSVPKSVRIHTPRINLTFRQIRPVRRL